MNEIIYIAAFICNITKISYFQLASTIKWLEGSFSVTASRPASSFCSGIMKGGGAPPSGCLTHVFLFFLRYLVPNGNFHREYSVYPSRTLTRILLYCLEQFGPTVFFFSLCGQLMVQLHHSRHDVSLKARLGGGKRSVSNI